MVQQRRLVIVPVDRAWGIAFAQCGRGRLEQGIEGREVLEVDVDVRAIQEVRTYELLAHLLIQRLRLFVVGFGRAGRRGRLDPFQAFLHRAQISRAEIQAQLLDALGVALAFGYAYQILQGKRALWILVRPVVRGSFRPRWC